MRTWIFAASIAVAGCQKQQPPPAAPPAAAAPTSAPSASAPAASAALSSMAEPDPAVDPLGFYRFMLDHHGPTLEKVACECCKKPLGLCYRQMFDPHARPRCPVG